MYSVYSRKLYNYSLVWRVVLQKICFLFKPEAKKYNLTPGVLFFLHRIHGRQTQLCTKNMISNASSRNILILPLKCYFVVEYGTNEYLFEVLGFEIIPDRFLNSVLLSSSVTVTVQSLSRSGKFNETDRR